MSVVERLLKSKSIEFPACQCGGKMAIERIELIPDSDARFHIYQCPYCRRELRLPEVGNDRRGHQHKPDAARANTVPQTVNRPDGSTSSYSAIKPSKHKAQRPLGRL